MSDSKYSSKSEDTQVKAMWGRDVQARITKKYGDPNKEVWVWVRGYEDFYKISNLGNVRSVTRTHLIRGGIRKVKGRLRRNFVGPTGYVNVILCKNSCHQTRKLSRLVLEAFVGPAPDGLVCCHNDGDSRNDRLENLRWDTPASNYEDRERHGRLSKGVEHYCAKLTVAKVRKARRLYDSGKFTVNRLAERFGVHRKTMWSVVERKTWKHVEDIVEE